MKVTVREFDAVFTFDFESETMEEQVMLVRFGINKTKERLYMNVDASKDENINAYISVGKRKHNVSTVGR